MTKRSSQLQREIQQAGAFHSPGQEAGLAVIRTADQIRWRLAQAIEPQGITLQQYNVLRILRGAGEAGMPTLEIARRMIERTPGITRLLDRLDAKRLVRRERCATDRRQVLCWIEPRGLELLRTLDDPVARADDAAMQGLSEPDLTRLVELLDRVRGEVR